MENVRAVVDKAEVIMGNPNAMKNIKLPALEEVLRHVAAAKDTNNSYTKFSAHTKSSTRGCPMGCLGG